ncbi:Alpha-amylase [Bifidobacterium dolichotidis]|uniref:Alpha-amylase n=1 Tax=Bifidobacterium dolichotidis TaxID=2306976 RepID=A0A430FP12_9BIFI|nr:DUF4179 domain-containing protein [Bifidobacterium dolichotidis]RSX54572.1 Alpha-amylase [Bifidobacterium dolichotidis]
MSNATKNLKKAAALSLSVATLLGTAFTASTAMAGGGTPQNLNNIYETRRTGYVVGDGFDYKNPSNWNQNMKISSAVANDDPRVYLSGWTPNNGWLNPLWEKPIDMYDLYGAYDHNNLYLMWEMVDVTDKLDASYASDTKPCDDGRYDAPMFIAVDNHGGKSGVKKYIGNQARMKEDGSTIWKSQNTWDTNQLGITSIIAMSNQRSKMNDREVWNYDGDQGGLNKTAFNKQGIEPHIMDTNIANDIYGFAGYKADKQTNRYPDECYNKNNYYVDYKYNGHNWGQRDYMYAIKIPLWTLDMDFNNMKSKGVDVQVVAGALPGNAAGIQSLPFDHTTLRDAQQYANNIDTRRSMAEISLKKFTVPFASVGGC